MVYGGRAFWKLAPLSSDVLQAVLRNTGELKWYAEYRYTAISTIWCQGNGASGSPVTVTWFREWALTGSSCSCAQCKNLFFFYPNTINATGGWALLLRLDLSFILFLAQAGFLCCCLTVSLLELCETTSTWSLWPWFLYKYDCSYCICVTITIFHIVQFFFFSSVSHWKLIKTFSLAHSPQMISFGNNIKTFPF